MKTILYQPLFTNPQAYFVFPQLYHIEKGDSYIEPANITGQLIINNLSEGLTLTPTVNVIQDSNQVDFSLFKGKHIRISQYTNIGAVVLGEWYIPGTPEPEQPDWFKESIVAWYSPYCKQGLTNYDVIEAYTEDFTTWVYNQNAGVANITSNTITISESFTSQNIVEDTNSPYSDLSIYVTGITEDVYLFVKDMSGRVEEIRKNGLYTFKNNSRFFGFSVNKPAACNIVIKQLPTSILKDFSGNKHDAYLYGFKGKLNSGVGIYAQDFKNWSPLTSISTFGFRATDNQIEFAGSTDGGTMSYILDDTDVTKFTIEYTNTAGEGNVYLMIGDKQYDVISGQLQTYSVSGSVKLEFLNMEEINNFAGTIKFTNVN